MDKRAIVEAIRSELLRALEVTTTAAQTAHAAATDDEMKPENDKDTRGLEAGYLAGAQSARAAELRRTLDALEAPMFVARVGKDDARGAIDVGALVALCEVAGRRRSTVFVAPSGGGLRVDVDGTAVQVVTPESPLGQALVGQRAGDVVELERGGRTVEIDIVRVA